MTHRRTSALLLGAAALTVGALAAPGSAAARPQTGKLNLSIVPERGTSTISRTLTCEPTGGDHPDGKAACADLIAAGGVIDRIPPTGRLCPQVFDPVTAVAQGVWNGLFVDYKKRFTNECFAVHGTGGHVFNLR